MNNKTKKVLSATAIIAVIGAVCAVYLGASDWSNSGLRSESEVTETEEVVQLDKPTADSATLKDLIERLYAEGIIDDTFISEDDILSSDAEKVFNSLGLFGKYKPIANIDRYQMSSILYELMLLKDKVPNIDGYSVIYSDMDDFPEKYITPIVAVTRSDCLSDIVELRSEFSGYTYVSKDELNIWIENFKDYLSNYDKYTLKVENESTTNVLDTNTKNKLQVEKEKAAKEAEKVLKDRKTDDRLNGQSVAIYNNPRTLTEIEANLNNITKVSISELATNDNYALGSKSEHPNPDLKVNVEYINLDEALVDKELMEEYISDIYTDMEGVNVEFTGVSRTDSMKFELDYTFDQNVLRSSDIEKMWDNYKIKPIMVAGINNHSIVSAGLVGVEIVGEDESNTFIQLPDYDIDTLGFIYRKDTLENMEDWSATTEEANTFDLVMLECSLSESDVATLQAMDK